MKTIRGNDNRHGRANRCAVEPRVSRLYNLPGFMRISFNPYGILTMPVSPDRRWLCLFVLLVSCAGAPLWAADHADLLKKVKAPDAFSTTIFAAPPEITYPTCITSTPDGTVFIGIDPDGSLGKRKGFGKVVRAVDTDHDGVADDFKTFCKVDHPRGLIYDNSGGIGRLWVLHPPHLTLYIDTDNDGIADADRRLVSGISTIYNEKRGADHTTNGIRMGIDGWIYIAVGDFGFAGAVGLDDTELTLLGGGIARVRPDGTRLQMYATGLRNIYDVAIDPYLNIFTRDNTNDGGGWNLRTSHIVQSGDYGYPRLFTNFTQEIIPALKDHGGGSGCGAMYLHAPGLLPAPYDNAALTCDWGTSKVYVHTPKPVGPSFTEDQDVFVSIPRPTDIDADATGQVFISSWNNGKFSYSGDNVGFIARLVSKDWKHQPAVDLSKLSVQDLIQQLASPSDSARLAAQREVFHRDVALIETPLVALATDDEAELYARIAAIFTLKQALGVRANAVLAKLASDPAVREWALRALTDRKDQLDGVTAIPFVAGLTDSNPRIRVAAAVGLGRLGSASVAPALLAAAKPVKIESNATATPDAYLPHVAVKALVALDAADACLAAIGSPQQPQALWALRYLHTDTAVDGLIARLATADTATKRELLDVLVRLYHREADYDGKWWWGTRPDRTGPYYKRVTWDRSERIAAAITKAAASADADTRKRLAASLDKHKVKIKGLDLKGPAVALKPDNNEPTVDVTKIAQQGKNAKKGVGAMGIEDVMIAIGKTKGNVKLGEKLFAKQGCIACHTTKEGQPLKGPYLGLIGSQYKRDELARSILRPAEVIAQGFSTVSVTTKKGGAYVGFVSREAADSIDIRDIAGKVTTIKTADIATRTELPISMMPPGLANALSPEEFASLLAYLESLK